MSMLSLLLNPPPVPPAPKQGRRVVLGMGMVEDEKACAERARKRAYYRANKDRILERQRAYREAHRREISAQKRDYYLTKQKG